MCIRDSDYVKDAGGYTSRGDNNNILIVRASGKVITNQFADIRQGDKIIVMPKVSLKRYQIAKDILDIIFKAASSAAVILAL